MRWVKQNLQWAGFMLVTALCLTIASCATIPEDLTQSIYVTQETLTEITNTVADAHDAGKLVGDKYEETKKIIKASAEALKNGRKALFVKNYTEAERYLAIATSLMVDLNEYKRQ